MEDKMVKQINPMWEGEVGGMRRETDIICHVSPEGAMYKEKVNCEKSVGINRNPGICNKFKKFGLNSKKFGLNSRKFFHCLCWKN